MTGWVGRMKAMVYARLEETSFRSGAAVGAAALAVAGLGVAFALTLGGHQVAPSRAVAAGAALPSARHSAPPSSAALSPSASPSARHSAPEPGSSPVADEVPEAPVTPATAEWTSRWHHRKRPPGWPFPWPGAFPRPWWWHSAG